MKRFNFDFDDFGEVAMKVMLLILMFFVMCSGFIVMIRYLIGVFN